MKPTSEATYERARRLANLSMWTVSLQCRRLRTHEPEDEGFVLRRLADFDFLIVALTRLRRAADIAKEVPETKQIISDALKHFNRTLPGLKKLRDVAEHIDDYAVDRGKDPLVRREELEISRLTDDGMTLNWLGNSLNADEALNASQTLFSAIQSASVALAKHG